MKRPSGFDAAAHSDPDTSPPFDAQSVFDARAEVDDIGEFETAHTPPIVNRHESESPDLGYLAAELDDADATREVVAASEHPTSLRLARVSQPREASDASVRRAAKDVRRAARANKIQERTERRRFAAPARRRRRRWLIAGGAVVALVLFVLAGVVTPLTAVRTVEVAGTALVDAKEVKQALSQFEGVPLALVDDDDVHRALEPFPLIQRYALERIPPHTLLVRLEERLPVLSMEIDGKFGLYDAAGVKIGTTDSPPVGVPVGSGGVLDVSSEAFRATATILRDIPASLREQVGGAAASSGQDVTLTLLNGVKVVWGEDTDTQRKAVVLAAMIKALADTPVEEIDVSSNEAPVFR